MRNARQASAMHLSADALRYDLTNALQPVRRAWVQAATRAIATSGQAVVFAGTTVVIAICGLYFVGIPLVAIMGYATAMVVAVAVVAAITLLPALLGFAGHAVDKLRIPGVKVTAVGADHKAVQRWWAQGVDFIVAGLGRG